MIQMDDAQMQDHRLSHKLVDEQQDLQIKLLNVCCATCAHTQHSQSELLCHAVIICFIACKAFHDVHRHNHRSNAGLARTSTCNRMWNV